jgi:hypothetical protein
LQATQQGDQQISSGNALIYSICQLIRPESDKGGIYQNPNWKKQTHSKIYQEEVTGIKH